MAEQGDWRSETFRRKVIAQIEDAVRSSNTPMAKSSIEMENHVFQKAKTREEYLALVARLILHVKDFNNQKKVQAQQAAMAAGMSGPSMGVAGGVVQQGLQDPINALQNMAGLGPVQTQGLMTGNQPMTGMPQQQQVARQQFLQQQMLQQRSQIAAGQQRPQLQRQDAFIVTSVQPVQPSSLPMQSSAPISQTFGNPQITGGAQMGRQMPLTQQTPFPQTSPVPPVSSQQGVTAPPAQTSGSQMVGSPMTMMTSPSPQSTVVPSPVSRTVGAPSPGSSLNTPGNPGSAGAAVSPATQSAEEKAYLDKLKQLSKYVEPLKRMIKKSEEDKNKDAEHRKVEMMKMKNLLDLLTNPQKRVPMYTLVKCEQVLEKLQLNFRDKPHSTAKPDTGLPTSLPVQPSSHMCQPLLDAVAAHIKAPTFNHILQKTFGPGISALYGKPIRCPSPPPKRQKKEETSKLPDLLQAEIAHLNGRFKVKLDPVQHSKSTVVHLICRLDDKNIPSVPPLVISVPEDYPNTSPQFTTINRDYESSPFLQNIKSILKTHTVDMSSRYSFTSLLDMWEMSVRKACISSTSET